MTEQPSANLNITDIADAVKVIDHAADQGAFRGWSNIRQILALRDRLDGFVSAATAATNPEPPTDTVIDPPSSDDHTNYSDIEPVVETLPPVSTRRRSHAAL
jgi:hypothetical protein